MPKIEFVAPMMGLPDHTKYDLQPLDDNGILFSLRCEEDPDLRLILADPMSFYPDYEPVIDREMADSLGLDTEEDAAVLAVVNPGQKLEEATINLMAPVVLNHKSHRAAQAVLTGSDFPLRAPLMHD
ncbi:flagellar assembly factor FliW [Kineococcus xinjiangensis]|uniref:Flagellar assembly factor FliW n=1 Tax=Kineococcus xinjiangensis TaxID=512762 RepID=A0A2S6ID46_9ACTN|nr:flagellar assembly protein FliW [Kineococcus xinjiangensis]PPK92144.1 flagellar assembly factor FliW [Kineococcus xinjiangensis]